MTPSPRSGARPTAVLLAAILLVTSASAGVAQTTSPGPTPAPLTASVGGVTYGGVLAAHEGRGKDAPASLRTGTAIDGLTLNGARGAFAPGESAAFRLELPAPLRATGLSARLVSVGGGVESIVGAGTWLTDPSWDTMTGALPVPSLGDYSLRLFDGETSVASATLAVRDVPRLADPLTDPFGLLADAPDRVQAAQQRFTDATTGWLWLVFIDTTAGAALSDYTADLWAVNADQLLAFDALAVAATTDVDVAVEVGRDLDRSVRPDEVAMVEDDARNTLADGRWADTVDAIADGLVDAHDNGPVVKPSPTPKPTPRPTAKPTPSPARFAMPNFVGLTRGQAQRLADESGLLLSVSLQQTDQARQGIVISQDPPPDTRVLPGTRVSIVVATQSPTVAVPDVRGLREADAIATLLEASLETGSSSDQPSSDIPRGRVIRTDPRAGIVVARGTAVDYILSTGPESIATPTPSPSPRPTRTPTPTPRPTSAIVTVPDVRGLDEADAVTLLVEAGLRAGTGTRKASASVAAGLVIRTDPAAGVRVARGSSVDYVISRGVPVTPSPTVAPTRPRPTTTARPPTTPRPTRRPTPPPTATPRPTIGPSASPSTNDLLARIRAAGIIRVNVDPSDAPWSTVSDDGGTAEGFDIDVARQIAQRLGVDVSFTTFPREEVVIGGWADRWDIAIEHLAITDPWSEVLAFAQPYAWDPAHLAVTTGSGLSTVEDLAGRAICVAQDSTSQAWLEGTLALTAPPVEPATPPEGATAFIVASDQDCLDAISAGAPPFDGWLASLVAVQGAVGAGAGVVPVGDPVFLAPIGIALDRSVADGASLLATIDASVADMHADGTLSALSSGWFGGLDLTTVEGAGAPAP